jgi:hypothetical protein
MRYREKRRPAAPYPGTRGVQTLFDGEDSLLQTVVKSYVYAKA